MVDIYVDKHKEIKDLHELLEENLQKDEIIKGKIVGINVEGVIYTQYVILSDDDYQRKGNKYFSNYAATLIVLLTNVRMLIVGIGAIKPYITGIRSVEYSEIKKVIIDELDYLKIVLNDNRLYEMQISIIDSTDEKIKEQSHGIEYLIDKLEYVKVKRKGLELDFFQLGKWIYILLHIAIIVLFILSII